MSPIPVLSGIIARRAVALPVALVLALFLFAIWPWLPVLGRGTPSRTIVFYGFSILDEAINTGIVPAFQNHWQQQTGEHVEFITSFSGSGTVTNQLIMGVPAQVALLSLELDAMRLADAGVIAPAAWTALPQNGVVNRTPFVILARAGNPKNIRDFADLARAGVGVVHPDPLTSGGANWAIVAEYGAGARAAPNDPEAGHRMLLGIWNNVVAQAASARSARTQFENGFGDALITYEQEVLRDRARGRLEGEIVYPRSTILSEHTLVVVPHNIRGNDRALIDAFVAFLWSDTAQSIFVRHGFRSVKYALNGSASFGNIADPFTISDMGGWKAVKRTIIDSVWRGRVLVEINQ
jgi:sulfate transport system substrate-binding protein